MLGRHRTTSPIIAMFSEGGQHVAKTVPTGTIVDLTGKKFNGVRLMDVLWIDRRVMMFVADLKDSSLPCE